MSNNVLSRDIRLEKENIAREIQEFKECRTYLAQAARVLDINIITLRKLIKIFGTDDSGQMLLDWSYKNIKNNTQQKMHLIYRPNRKNKLYDDVIDKWWKFIEYFRYEPTMDAWYYRTKKIKDLIDISKTDKF